MTDTLVKYIVTLACRWLRPACYFARADDRGVAAVPDFANRRRAARTPRAVHQLRVGRSRPRRRLACASRRGGLPRLVRQAPPDPGLRLAPADRGRLRRRPHHPAADDTTLGEVGMDALRDLCPRRRHPGAGRGQARGCTAPAAAPLERRGAGPAGGGRAFLAGAARRDPDEARRAGAGTGAAHRRSALSRQPVLHRARRRPAANP